MGAVASIWGHGHHSTSFVGMCAGRKTSSPFLSTRKTLYSFTSHIHNHILSLIDIASLSKQYLVWYSDFIMNDENNNNDNLNGGDRQPEGEEQEGPFDVDQLAMLVRLLGLTVALCRAERDDDSLTINSLHLNVLQRALARIVWQSFHRDEEPLAADQAIAWIVDDATASSVYFAALTLVRRWGSVIRRHARNVRRNSTFMNESMALILGTLAAIDNRAGNTSWVTRFANGRMKERAVQASHRALMTVDAMGYPNVTVPDIPDPNANQPVPIEIDDDENNPAGAA